MTIDTIRVVPVSVTWPEYGWRVLPVGQLQSFVPFEVLADAPSSELRLIDLHAVDSQHAVKNTELKFHGSPEIQSVVSFHDLLNLPQRQVVDPE